MKKFLMIAAALSLAVALIILGYRYSYAPGWLLTRIYQGDRIVINMHITVDGKKAVIKEDNNYTDEEMASPLVFSLKDKEDKTVLSAKADSYDFYCCYLTINDKIPLRINALHLNWWEITRSDLYIDIDTRSNTYTTSERYKYTMEGELGYSIKTVDEKQETFLISNGMIIASIGPKG